MEFRDNSFFPVSICDKYATATKQSGSQLITAIVSKAVGLIVANGAPTKPHFDGTNPPGSTNFLTDTAAFNALSTKLVQYFGSALGCRDGSIAGQPATPPDQSSVHRGLGIFQSDLDFFNAQVASSAQQLGVSAADLTVVGTFLASLSSQIVFTNLTLTPTISAAPNTGPVAPSFQPDPDFSAPGALSTGVIVGIVIGCIVSALILTAILFGGIFYTSGGVKNYDKL